MPRVVLAMSGGVDSGVAAWLLCQQGHEVIGVFMRHGVEEETVCPTVCDVSVTRKQGCCTAADAADARRTADVFDVPFYAVNFEAQFERIVDYFIDEYTAGRTPNPCIQCNTWLKFGKLFDYAAGVDADYVATGHYARLLETEAGKPPGLHRGVDPSKDQSYVLFGIERKILPRLMFPVGEYHKNEIRQMAERIKLRVAEKRDSQEICFVPDQNHARFIRERRPDLDTSGEIVTTDGQVVGRHDGFERYTIGQRKGLGVAFGERRFVVRLEPDTHRVVVGTRDELGRSELTAAGANWLIDEPTAPFAATVKIRYRSRPEPAMVEPLGEGQFHVRFEAPCYGVAPGQAAVVYDGDRVLGGGWIE